MSLGLAEAHHGKGQNQTSTTQNTEDSRDVEVRLFLVGFIWCVSRCIGYITADGIILGFGWSRSLGSWNLDGGIDAGKDVVLTAADLQPQHAVLADNDDAGVLARIGRQLKPGAGPVLAEMDLQVLGLHHLQLGAVGTLGDSGCRDRKAQNKEHGKDQSGCFDDFNFHLYFLPYLWFIKNDAKSSMTSLLFGCSGAKTGNAWVRSGSFP